MMLENELHKLNSLKLNNDPGASQPSPKPNKAVKITKTTPSQMASANTRGKFPVTIPPSALRTPTSQKIQTAKLPWIPANKSRVKTPNSKKPPYFEFEDIQLVIPTKEVIEHRHTQLPLRPTLALKNEVISTCPSTCYKIPSAQPHPNAHLSTTEENSSHAATLFYEASANLRETKELLVKLSCALNLPLPK